MPPNMQMLTNIQRKIEEYLRNKSVTRLTANSQKTYRFALTYLDNYCKRRGIIRLEPKLIDMDDFVLWCYKNKLRGASVNHYVIVVKQLFKFHGKSIEYKFKLTMDEIKQAKIKRLRRWFSEDEVERCLKYKFASNPVRGELIVRLMVESAARVHEISRVIAENIDIENRTIWIVSTKTDPRTIFFSPHTAHLFESFKLQHPVWTGRIFPTTSVIRSSIKEMLSDLGLKEKDDGRGPHTFRHYAATWLYYEGGMKLTELSTLMGATVGTLQKVYLHPTPLMLRKRVDKAWGWK